jgi:hypothetical protein
VHCLSQAGREHNDKDPALALDRAGRLWIAWQSYQAKADRVLARSLFDGTPGELIGVCEHPGIHFQPSVACDAEGTVWVVWSAQGEAGWQVLARPLCAGQAGAICQLCPPSALACYPSATSDASGRVWAAWTMVREGQHRIAGAWCADGDWSETRSLSPGCGECYRPVLCGGREGVWLAYESRFEGAYELHLRRWTPSDLGPVVRFPLSDAWELHPRLCSDNRDGVWATWVAAHDVRSRRGAIDHRVEVMAAHFDGKIWSPYRSPDHTKPPGFVAPLYDGLLGRNSYWGFIGHRRRPQIVREEEGEVWVLFERKEDETINRRGPDALLHARPLTGPGQGRTYELDTDAYAYTVSGDIPVVGGALAFAGQIAAGVHYGDICAGTLRLDRSRPVRTRPPSEWQRWRGIALPDRAPHEPRPTIQVNGETYRLYWGDTHCHSTFSGDAEGEIDECYAYGRYKARLDFMAVTDNDHIYDDTLTPSAWALLRTEAGLHNQSGEFVVFSGYERSHREEAGLRHPHSWRGTNHRIILYADEEQPICRHTEPDADTLEKFVAFTEPTNAFVYPHHAAWRLLPSSRLGGVEVCSSWDVYLEHADTIHQALEQGYRLAFLGTSDTHRIVPGLGGALTGVWARELTREAIWDALWARRCYATNGERVILDVRVDGAPVGSDGVVVNGVAVHCKVRSPRTIQYVDLIRDGTRVRRQGVNAGHATVIAEDDPGPGEHFYYVRVQLKRPPGTRRYGQARGNRGNLQVARGDYAWSSPIWVRVVPRD